MARRIKRNAIRIATDHDTGFFKPLFRTVVTWRANGRPVLSVPEQLEVALVRNLVIDNGCRLDQSAPLAQLAQRVLRQEPLARLTPLPCVATVVRTDLVGSPTRRLACHQAVKH